MNNGISRAVIFILLAAAIIWIATRDRLPNALQYLGFDIDFDENITFDNTIGKWWRSMWTYDFTISPENAQAQTGTDDPIDSTPLVPDNEFIQDTFWDKYGTQVG